MVDFLRWIYYWLATALVAVVSFVFYPCRVYGRGNIPQKGGVIYASNHESNIDPMLIPVCSPRQMRFMAKEELFRNPFWGWIIRTGGGFPVKRASVDRGALNEFIHQLKLGYAVLIFPQGTRGGSRPQSGVGFVAANSGMPVIPILIEGTDKVLPKGAKFPKRTPVSLTFGQPLVFSKDQSYEEIAQKVMTAIEGLRSQPR